MERYYCQLFYLHSIKIIFQSVIKGFFDFFKALISLPKSAECFAKDRKYWKFGGLNTMSLRPLFLKLIIEFNSKSPLKLSNNPTLNSFSIHVFYCRHCFMPLPSGLLLRHV